MAAPYIADSYTRADRILAAIAEDITYYVTSVEKAVATIDKAAADLGKFPSAYPTGFLESIQYINTQATANPTDEAWQDLKRRKDKLVADFNATKNRFEAISTAINGL